MIRTAFFGLLLVLASAAPALAQDDAKTAKDPGWSAPDSVTIPIGGTGYLKVKIDRKKIRDDVQLKVSGLPQGVSVKGDAPPVLKSDVNEFTFVLLANPYAPAAAEHKIKVHLTRIGADEMTKEVPARVVNFELQAGSGLVMGISIVAVLALTGFCIWRVMTLPPVEVEEHLKGPLEIDTRDTKDAD